MFDIRKVKLFLLMGLVLLAACAPQATPAPVPTNAPAAATEIPTQQATLFLNADPIPVQPEIPSLYETLADYFPVGAALMSDQLDSGQHVYLLARHFNGLTPENEMKPISIQPVEGTFTWEGADRLMQFARDNKMQVHGHTLVWHSQVPDWMFNDSQGQPLTATPENKALVLSRMETHIRALAGRYKGEIFVWDVVNEVIDESYPDCMRRSRWFELTGSDYITLAFKVAHEADPNARLIINDYSTTDPAKRTCFYNLTRDLLAQGVPLDGVGHQMHINIESPSAEDIEETIQMFAELGVEQYITELDLSLYTNDSDSFDRVPKEIMIRQAHRYKDIFDVFRRQSESLAGVTFWGMADDHTWLKTWPIRRINLPLLFDENLQAKYAYWGIVDPSFEHLPVLHQRLSISQATPEIDAKPELLWSQQPWIALAGLPNASFQTRWDKQYLYVFVDIKGDPESISKIELFVDENKNKTKSYEADDRHYSFENGVCVDCEGVKSAQATADGYQLEVALPFNVGSGRGGQQVGFDIRITDSTQPGPVSWNDLTNGQDTDTSQFGGLTFALGSKMTSAKAGTPTIDGEEDAVWADAPEISTDVWVMGTSGATARVKTLWDDEYLYVYAVVTDTLLSDASRNPWEQDTIEVYVDQNNAKTASYEADDSQYRVNFKNVQTFNGGAKAELITSAVKIVPGGYVVELSIKLDVIPPQENALIGFDFQVNNDENGDGVRDSVVIWNDPTGQSYMNTSRLGLLQFAK